MNRLNINCCISRPALGCCTPVLTNHRFGLSMFQCNASFGMKLECIPCRVSLTKDKMPQQTFNHLDSSIAASSIANLQQTIAAAAATCRICHRTSQNLSAITALSYDPIFPLLIESYFGKRKYYSIQYWSFERLMHIFFSLCLHRDSIPGPLAPIADE